MSTGRLGWGERREFLPTYGDIHWHSVYKRTHEEDSLPVWFETEDELGELVMQCHQENMAFYLNKTNPSFDAFVIQDPRDDTGIWFTRDKLGDQEFNRLLNSFYDEVMVVQTKYPMQNVAEAVLRFLHADVVQLPES